MQAVNIRLHHMLGKQKHPGAVGHLVQRLDKPQSKLRKLNHGAGHITQNHQALAVHPFFSVAQGMKAAACFQSLADGAAEFQLAGMRLVFSLGGQLAVNLLGDALDDGNGLGDFRILERPQIPVEDAHLGVGFHALFPCRLHEHLLLHDGLCEHGVDKLVVQPRVALHVVFVALHKILEPLPCLLGHGHVGFPLPLVQPRLLPHFLQFLLRLLAALLHLLLPLLLLLRLTAHFLLGDEEPLEDAVKGQLLLPGAGKHRPQRRLYLLPVCHSQGNEGLGGIRRLRRTDGQPFQPQQPGKGRELL